MRRKTDISNTTVSSCVWYSTIQNIQNIVFTNFTVKLLYFKNNIISLLCWVRFLIGLPGMAGIAWQPVRDGGRKVLDLCYHAVMSLLALTPRLYGKLTSWQNIREIISFCTHLCFSSSGILIPLKFHTSTECGTRAIIKWILSPKSSARIIIPESFLLLFSAKQGVHSFLVWS